jgi:hypothetical protein
LNIIIELDGKQHFVQVSNWKSPDEQLKTDIFKMKKANQNNYSVIRIIQEDVLKDTYNWQSRLCENINKIQTENIVQNLFISTSDEYEILPSLLQLDIDFENITLDDEDEEDDDKS